MGGRLGPGSRIFFAAAMLARLLGLAGTLGPPSGTDFAAAMPFAKASAGKVQAPRPNVPTTRPFAGLKWRSSASAGGINAPASSVSGAHLPLAVDGLVSVNTPKPPANNVVLSTVPSGLNTAIVVTRCVRAGKFAVRFTHVTPSWDEPQT